MRLRMHSVHFDADAKLIGYVQRKLEKLDTFYDRITGGDVYFRLDKSENSKVRSKVLEIKINIPGSELFVKENGQTFEEATDLALEALKIQVKKFKDKKAVGKGAKKVVMQPDDNDDLDFDDL